MTGFLLTISYTALLLFFMRRMRFFNSIPGLSFRWVTSILLLKVLAGTVLWAIYTYVYPDRTTADVFKYYDDSAHMFKALYTEPADYLRMVFGIGNDTEGFWWKYYKDMNNWERAYESNMYNDSHTIIRFNAVVRLISFGEFHVHTLVAAFLAFTGMVGIYRAFVASLVGLERILTAAVFLVPSVLFWASGVIKESLLFFGLGLLLYQVTNFLAGRWRWWDPFLLLFTTAMLFFLKFYVLMSLIPALMLLIWGRSTSRPALWLKTVLICCVFLLIGSNLHHILPGWNILGILTMKQRDFVGLALSMDSGSFVMPTLLLPDVRLFATQAPYALYIALLGPLFHGGGSALGLVAGAENAGLILFLFMCVAFREPWRNVDHALFFSILSYVFVLALVIGYTTPVMGAVVRYRTPLLPFLLIAGLLLLDRDRLLNKWPSIRPLLSA